jgi:hypothetical protein
MRPWLPILLALATPPAAWSAPVDTARPKGVVAATPQASSLPATPHAPAVVSQAADPATSCETAITTTEYVARLPPRLLGAISLIETGRVDPTSGRVRPWPWTINAEGEGRFFATRQQAVTAVKGLQARGVRSIDVGCLQVNLMHHPDAFATLEVAFDPLANAAYAGRFLNALFADGRNWARAVAAYHSETPALGDAYRALVMARWQNSDLRAASPTRTAYGDFARSSQAYGAFAPISQVYRAFALPSGGR